MARKDRRNKKPAKPKEPKILQPEFFCEGSNGRYVVSFALVKSDRSAASQVPVILTIAPWREDAYVEKSKQTDENGLFDYPVKFYTRWCDITVSVAGYSKKFDDLDGPSSSSISKEIGRPDDADATSPFAVLRWLNNKRKELLRRRST